MRFTLRQLAYFVAAGETGSVTQASERVNISQPSISAAILHLEREFGVQFFIRHHAQGLSLTPAGIRFLQAAKAALQSAHELYDVASEATNSISGPINIGAFFTYAPLLIPELCKTFLDSHPRVELNVTEGSEASLIEKLRHAQIDLALTYEMYITPDIGFEPLVRLPTYALVPAEHPFALRSSVRLDELCGEPFVLLDLPLSREYFLSLFTRAEVYPNIVAHTPSPETLRSYVGSGFGVS
ncbi:MAG TPA: LysR family transcriptional regulator, partial [Paracoccaceae bacterium]|nr:LysR family transcriptional regulator [Paracoccaceae bacterium]